jgi:hypothetical protein
MTVAIVKWRLLETVIIFLDPFYTEYLIDSLEMNRSMHTRASGLWIDLKTDRQTDRRIARNDAIRFN